MEANFITSILLPAALFIIMLGMGLSLIVEDFKRVVLYPKAVLIALANQLLLLPVIGFVLTFVFGLQAELAVGLMLIAACPGGATSNLISHLAKGDTALSITLTAISSLITIFTIPFIINFSLLYFMERGQYISLDVPATIMQIIAITVAPALWPQRRQLSERKTPLKLFLQGAPFFLQRHASLNVQAFQ